jgi:EpsD family peptidyl-prolyl cis-trans isomerase
MIRSRLINVALAAACLASCNKEATGQVAAVVNGEEITLQEINAELGNMAVAEGVEKQAIQQAALQRIIERRLLAQVASNEGMDKSADFLLRQRQLRDALLVQLLGQKADRALAVPDQQAIDRYIASNPASFQSRKIYTVDRIDFPMPANPQQLTALQADHSMEAVASRLEGLGIKFRRGEAQMDSAQLGQERLQRILSLPDGEPFVIPENGVVTVAIITGEQEAPVSAEDARPIAVQGIRNQQLRDTLQQRLKQAKAEAEITYQEEFAPPSSTATSATKATPASSRQ